MDDLTNQLIALSDDLLFTLEMAGSNASVLRNRIEKAIDILAQIIDKGGILKGQHSS